MGKIAFLFAGQGAQYPGMGQELAESSTGAAEIFAMADAYRPGTSQLCFTGTAEELAQTIHTQPCVFSVDLSAAAALVDAGIHPEGVAGFSLGEMAALAFAGGIQQEDAFALVCKRAALMQAAAQKTTGGMAAVLRLSDQQVDEICKEFSSAWPVNYNCEGQLVVAAVAEQLEEVCQRVAQQGGVAKPLAVSGGFHSPLMAGAAKEFLALLQEVSFKQPEIPVYANLTGEPYQMPVAPTLAAQIESPVLWKQTVQNMCRDGFTTFIEVGPGKTLTGLNRRICKEAKNLFVQDAKSLANTLEGV